MKESRKNENYKRVYFHNSFHNTSGRITVKAEDEINSFVELEIAYPEKAKRLRGRLCSVNGCECYITLTRRKKRVKEC